MNRAPRTQRWMFLVLLALAGGQAHAASLAAPLGLRWGASPQAVDQELRRSFAPAEATTPGDASVAGGERFVEELHYSGQVLGLAADQVSPLFHGGQLFSVAVSFTPTQALPATAIWDQAVERLTQAYGAPVSRNRPTQLISWNAILRLLPPEANKTELMTLYNAAETDANFGRHLLSDLQVQVGLWVPEAIWRFDNGAVVKAVMRAGGNGPYGIRSLKPTVLYTRYEQLK